MAIRGETMRTECRNPRFRCQLKYRLSCSAEAGGRCAWRTLHPYGRDIVMPVWSPAAPAPAPLACPRAHWVPQRTIFAVGLIGGGQLPLPGDVSLAHNGVLCRDARPEFRRHMLEVLPQPLEEGSSAYSRAGVLDLAELATSVILAARVPITGSSRDR
jgi:Magnesium chelatase, subunit ChlI